MNPPRVVTPFEVKVVPFGFKIETVLPQQIVLPMVTLLIPKLTCCPAVPSKTTSPMLPAVLIATIWLLPPISSRPAKSTSTAVKGGGGAKKSPALTALPNGVATDTLPDIHPIGPEGTLVESVVSVTEMTVA